MKVPLDIIGDIAILKFSRHTPLFIKKIYSLFLLRKNKQIKVVLEKASPFSGKLRTQKTNFISGEKRKTTYHRENGCSFYLNIDEVYFSPRLSEERKVVSEAIIKIIKKNKIPKPSVLIMFGGISPQAVVLANSFKKSNIHGRIISSELNKEANFFAKKNVHINRVSELVELLSGDSREHARLLNKKHKKFDFILMLRPNLKETFLKSAFLLARKGTIFFYHGFGSEEGVRSEVLSQISLLKKKVKNFEIRKAGDIGKNIFRWNVSFEVC